MNCKIAIALSALSCLVACKSVDPAATRAGQLERLIDEGNYAQVRAELPAFHASHPGAAEEVIDYGLRRVAMPPDVEGVELPRALELLDALAVPGSARETTVHYAQGLAELKSGHAQEAHALFRGVVERSDASAEQLGVSSIFLALLEADDAGHPDADRWMVFLQNEDAVGDVLPPEIIAKMKSVMGAPPAFEMARAGNGGESADSR